MVDKSKMHVTICNNKKDVWIAKQGHSRMMGLYDEVVDILQDFIDSATKS